MTRRPASASGAICFRQPYQNSGKPCSRTTAGPSFGPAVTAFKCPQAILKVRSLYVLMSLHVLISLQGEELVELRARHHLLVKLRCQIELTACETPLPKHRLQLFALFRQGRTE